MVYRYIYAHIYVDTRVRVYHVPMRVQPAYGSTVFGKPFARGDGTRGSFGLYAAVYKPGFCGAGNF